MRKLMTWVLVTLGIAALVRRLKRSKETAAAHEGAPVEDGDDPADELRRKLHEQRAAGEPEEAPAAPAAESVDERRAGVHEQGRATLVEMNDSPDR